MPNIYEDGADFHVRGTYVYAKANDAYAYADAAKTIKISAADLQAMFLKGMVMVVDTDIHYAPVSFGVSATVGTLTYVKTDGSTPTTAVLATLKSKEYTG